MVLSSGWASSPRRAGVPAATAPAGGAAALESPAVVALAAAGAAAPGPAPAPHPALVIQVATRPQASARLNARRLTASAHPHCAPHLPLRAHAAGSPVAAIPARWQ